MKVKTIVLIIISLFVFGWFANDFYYSLSFRSNEVDSPGNWLNESKIKIKEDYVILMIEDATWSKFTNTNSMDPVIDESSHAIKIRPKNYEDVSIGDIISYKSSEGVIIHRVISKGEDSEGDYFITKGDNNHVVDSKKVRFDSITGVVVGIIY